MPPQPVAEKRENTQPQTPERISPKSKKMSRGLMIGFLVVIFAGIGTGYVLATQSSGIKGPSTAPGVTKTNSTVGIEDEETFRDCAEGTVEANDLEDVNSEGSHKLLREGGPSQTIHMTSSILALDDYIGKKVEVCGETLDSKKVAWFMDVGRLKLLE